MHSEAEATTALVALNLQVILAPDGDQWVAQAIEIDYAAAGDSKEDAKERFQEGLTRTITAHFKRFGHLDNFVVSAPAAYWRDQVKKGDMYLFKAVSMHEFEEAAVPGFPFGTINFYTSDEGEAA